jgi:hypothetical protein
VEGIIIIPVITRIIIIATTTTGLLHLHHHHHPNTPPHELDSKQWYMCNAHTLNSLSDKYNKTRRRQQRTISEQQQ